MADRPMTATAAAAVWCAEKRRRLKAERKFKAAEQVLKEHFRKGGPTDFKGVHYALTHPRNLVAELVRNALTDKQVEACTVEGDRETLTLIP